MKALGIAFACTALLTGWAVPAGAVAAGPPSVRLAQNDTPHLQDGNGRELGLGAPPLKPLRSTPAASPHHRHRRHLRHPRRHHDAH